MNFIFYKNNLKKAGDNISLSNSVKHSKLSLIVQTVLTIFSLIILLFYFSWFSLLLLSIFLSALTQLYVVNRYSRINGIYRYGVINNEYLKWDEVHSYKWIDDETISLLFKKNGNRVDFHNIKDKDKLYETFKENNIRENNN